MFIYFLHFSKEQNFNLEQPYHITCSMTIVKNYLFIFVSFFIFEISEAQTDESNWLINTITTTSCNLSTPVNNQDNVTTATVTVNSQSSGDYQFSPSATVLDVLHVTNQGTGQVDFKIMSAVNIKKLILVNSSSGTVKFRAGGNFPYPTITYCDLVDTSNSAVFESTVTSTSNTGICSANSDCYPSGSTLDDLDITVSDNLLWYDASSGGNLLSGSQVISEGTTYYAANSDGAGCESSRLAVSICLSDTNSTPFNCRTEGYLTQENDLYSVNLASGQTTLQAENITTNNINATAYNPVDGYLWASLSSTKSIVRIGDNFVTDTYTISALPNENRYIGDINADGVYFLKPAGTTAYKIDLDPNSSSYLESLGTLTLSTNIVIHDWAFNALDNNLYAVEKNTNVLYRINPLSGNISSLGEVPILSGNTHTYGASYFDSSGNFYVGANQTGTIYIIYAVNDLTGSNAISSNYFAFGSASLSNDGARCPTASVPQEVCDNGIDDDGDGLVDCDDMSCSNVGTCDDSSTSEGNDGGLESTNRLSQKINKRNYWRAKKAYRFHKSQAKRIKKTTQYKSKSAREVRLSDFIPLDVLSNSEAIESTPTDLVGITNATEVLSVDYLRDSKNIGTILITKTTDGAYEHTKYICDRLLGAEILSISSLKLNNNDFIKTLIKHPNGARETVVSFSVKEETPNSYSVDSHWNLDRYSASSTYYNFQIWTNSTENVYRLTQEVLELVNAQKPIIKYNTSAGPNVFVRKASYRNGKLDFYVTNTNASKTLNIEGGKRITETSSTEPMSLAVPLAESLNASIALEVGHLFDVGLRVHVGAGQTPDDVFMSDGSWGVDDFAGSTTIQKFDVTPQQNFDENAGLVLERGVDLISETSEYVSVYRSFTPTFQPVDLSTYTTLKFNASGTGELVITLLKKGIIPWEQQFKKSVSLTNEQHSHVLSLIDFKNDLAQEFKPDDITTMIFTLSSDDGSSQIKQLSLSNVSFSQNDVLAIDDLTRTDQDKSMIKIVPNPIGTPSEISFLSNVSERCQVLIYNTIGTLVEQRKIDVVSGHNTLILRGKKLSRGLYFLKLQGSNTNFKTSKLLVE